MALPALSKTWQFDVNAAAASGVDAHWLRVKQSMTGFGTLPWTVVGSSNSVAASTGFPMDGVDRWTTVGDVVIANSPSVHSWIVLKQTGISAAGQGFQVLIEPRTSSQITVVVSPSAGFGSLATGSTTTRPTATDEYVIASSALSLGQLGAGLVSRVHCIQSTDGQATRVFAFHGGLCLMVLAFDKPKNPVSGWNNLPWFALCANTGALTEMATYATFNTANTSAFAKQGATAFNPYLTVEGFNALTMGAGVTFSNDLDAASYPICPIGLVSTTVGARGRHGEVFDMWFGSTIIPSGDNYPGDASKQFVQIGHLIIPWNGTNILRS